MGRKASTLRGVVKSCNVCHERFKEAESLAKNIFSKESPYVPLPFFTEHGGKHCESIEKYLNMIIWRREERSRYDFIPNAEEAMYLLSAVWLHDIGMWYLLWDNEDPSDLTDVKVVSQLREEHDERTLGYIQEKWSDHCSWRQIEKEYLSHICFYHRRKNPIDSLEPPKIRGIRTDEDVRLINLAALLRLADGMHIDDTRAPAQSENLYLSLGMKQESKQHWGKAGLIRQVEKDESDPNSKKIKITGHYPKPHPYEFGVFDLKDVGEVVCSEVQKELQSVRPILSQHVNTSFTLVKHAPHRMTLAGSQKLYVTLWPYLLKKLTSSTEVAAAMVEILLLVIGDGTTDESSESIWRDDISTIIDRVQDSHPFDFMVRNLCKELEIRLERNNITAKRLVEYLKSVKERIKDNYDKMAEFALSIIDPEDFLVVYGHSTNTLRLLEEIPQKQHRHLYIVECYRKTPSLWQVDEDKRIKNRSSELGFGNIRFIYFHAFSQALAELTERRKSCKLLLGTHGVVTESNGKKVKEYICKTGSDIVATMAKNSGVAKVIVFAETEKVLRNGLFAKDIAGPNKLFSWDNDKQHPKLGVMYLPPTMDKVGKSNVDYHINEKGMFYAKTGRRISRSGSDRRVSSPT